jgi:hypothetical protein
MSFAQEAHFLVTLIVVLTLLLTMATALALYAVLEARRMRIIAARIDPIFAGDPDALMPPVIRRLVERMRKAGGGDAP